MYKNVEKFISMVDDIVQTNAMVNEYHGIHIRQYNKNNKMYTKPFDQDAWKVDVKMMSRKVALLINFAMTKLGTLENAVVAGDSGEFKTVERIFYERNYTQKLYDIPPTILTNCLIVCALRYLLAHKRVGIDPKYMVLKIHNKDVDVWREFASMYSYVILAV